MLLALGSGISQGAAVAAGYMTGHDSRMLAVGCAFTVTTTLFFFSTAGQAASKKFLLSYLDHSIVTSGVIGSPF
jgi:hypothetical protein